MIILPLLLLAVIDSKAQAATATSVPPLLSVAEVVSDGNEDFVPDRLGERVTVQGILTSDPLPVARNSALANMQDGTAGILLYSRSASRLINRVKVGDEVIVTGVVGQYEGAEQIILDEIEFVREATVPEPVVITTKDFTDERYSGRLVRVDGRLEVLDRTDGINVSAVLRDAFGEINVFIPSRFYADPGFVRQLLSIPHIELIGIASQADQDPPFDGGYRLVPRTAADLTFFPDPPYRAIVVSISVALLLVASLMLWRSRRQAEQSALGMKNLTLELQSSESRLRENQTRLRLLTQQVPAIVWSIDTGMVFTSSAGAGLNALKLKQDEVVGMSLFEYFQTEDPKSAPISAHRRAMNGRPTTFQARWADREYECRVEPMRDGEGKIVGAIGLALDITARHHAEQELKEQSDTLRHSQKMEAVGRLAGGVAHDFNNLVTVIKGYCDLISLKLGPDHDLQDWFQEIKGSANRAASLTTQLLAFSRKQVLEPRVFDLNEVLADLNKLLRRIIGEHIELVTDLVPDLGPVKVDKGQIEQVIMNLAVNAYDAMPKGGQLTLRTEDYVATGEKSGAPGQLAPGRYSVISFSDTGEGMSSEVRSHIFEPFFTTKEVGKGTGLGLATVYGIISQSGGCVEVESQLGEGTTFRIYLPVTELEKPDKAQRPAAVRDTTGNETIMVAEDEVAVRSLIKRTLEERGYKVIEAANGHEALQLSEELAERIDCLVTDVVMPKMSGFKLSQEIQKSRPGIKVLYVSGYAYTGRHEGSRVSPDTFLAKPFSPEMLALKLHRILNDPAKVMNHS